jgi:hypothetical protein
MSNIDIDYENHKISLSLGAQSLNISVLNNVSYDLYSLDVNQLIFNDNRIKFSNLFNLIKAGLNKSDKSISVTLVTLVKTMNFKLDVNNDYTTFSHTFELIKQENGTIDLKEIKKSIILLNKKMKSSYLDNIWKIALSKIDDAIYLKYQDILSCLEKELNEDVINEFKIVEGNKKNYFEIKSSILITFLAKYKGDVVQGGNYPSDGTNSLNLIWNGNPGWNTKNSTQNFNNGQVYDLSLELKKILNNKKLNIIFHSKDNKWWITFLGLP